MRIRPVHIGAAFLIGLILHPVSALFNPLILEFYDDLYPVVVMRGHVVHKDADSVDIQIGGKKNRACEFLRLQAFTRTKGVLRDANLKRLDAEETGSTKPIGTFDIGVWRVWPLADSSSVEVWVNHDCDGRIVSTRIAKV